MDINIDASSERDVTLNAQNKTKHFLALFTHQLLTIQFQELNMFHF